MIILNKHWRQAAHILEMSPDFFYRKNKEKKEKIIDIAKSNFFASKTAFRLAKAYRQIQQEIDENKLIFIHLHRTLDQIKRRTIENKLIEKKLIPNKYKIYSIVYSIENAKTNDFAEKTLQAIRAYIEEAEKEGYIGTNINGDKQGET